MRIVTDMIEFCTREVPRWNTVSISGYHIREAGATARRSSPSPSPTASAT
jgi:methylmalonyl-CoA mutase N-terminal domain/subunit